jgi:predicted porin
MNKKLSMAVAGAVLAMGASAANAGITIPAGDWTIDIGGNVNAFYTYDKADDNGAVTIDGGIARSVASGSEDSATNINTGLLPSAIGIGGKTRQNDLDVAFQFTFFPGISSNRAAATNGSDSAFGGNSLNIRQAYLTFGDKSWGTIKMGRDLGIFESDAILSDMTLLGVGGAGYASGTTTLGRIGLGYLYADWNAQISYASPNWNGFSFAVGVFDPWDSIEAGLVGDTTVAAVAVPDGTSPQFQGKVSYEWAGDVSGKVWSGFIYQDFENAEEAKGWDIGAKVNVAGFGLVASYYDGEAIGTTGFGVGAHSSTVPASGDIEGRDSDGWYLQGTYTLPNIGTKIGLSYGESKLDEASDESVATLVQENSMWTVGVYHPLTKSLNLVAEYNNTESENQAGDDAESDSISLGAILFF